MHAFESHTHVPPWQVHVLGSFRSTHCPVASSRTSLQVDVNHRQDRFAVEHRPPGVMVLVRRAAAHACRRRCRCRAALLERRFRTSSGPTNVAVGSGSVSVSLRGDAAIAAAAKSLAAAAEDAAAVDSAAVKAKRMICLALSMVRRSRRLRGLS